jgi:hypothetical protein
MITEIRLTDAPSQEMTTILDGRRCTLRFRYAPTSDRWSFDLMIGDVEVLTGRRVVTGVDLIAPFNFGIGAIVAVPWVRGAVADRRALPDRSIRVLHVSPDEIDAIRAGAV